MEEEAKGFVKKYSEIEEMDMPGGATIRWLITHRDHAPNFSMRLVNIKSGKSTPSHTHYYEHEIFVISGKGEFVIGPDTYQAGKDHFVFIPGNVHHTIRAKEDMTFICVVPISAAKEILGE